MTTTTIIAIIVIAALIAVGAVLYLYLKEKSLDEIRADVYLLFLEAEHAFESGEGQQKMDYVIYKARDMLPSWLQFFITDELLRKIIQCWFDAVKDLLDDGKYNHSTQSGE